MPQHQNCCTHSFTHTLTYTQPVWTLFGIGICWFWPGFKHKLNLVENFIKCKEEAAETEKQKAVKSTQRKNPEIAKESKIPTTTMQKTT